jgi:hypothetical protein
MLVSIATGLVLLSSTAAFAEKDATAADPTVQRTEQLTSDVHTSDLTGGFYSDNYKDDDWYFDFYEGGKGEGDPFPGTAGLAIDPQCRAELEKLCEGVEAGGGRIRRCFEANEGKLTPSCRTQVYERWSETTAIMGMAGMAPKKEGQVKSRSESKSQGEARKIRPDAIRTSGTVQFVDAANPVNAQASSPHSQGSAFKQYYDDPWYYEERDASYTMTSRPAPDDPHHRSTEVVKGNITRLKQVRNRTWGGQNTVVEIKPPKGNLAIIDLGPTQPLLDLALVTQDSITATGPTQHIGPYSVLMANQVRSGDHKVTVDRAGAGSVYARREADGRLDRIMEVGVRGTGEKHSVAAIKSESGQMMLIDLGPATAGNIPAGTAAGDHVVASGPVATVGNYPVLFAEQVSIANATPIKVARPDGNYPGASRKDMEAFQTFDSGGTTEPKNIPQPR